MKNALIALGIFAASVIVHARGGTEVGNGGDAVVCRSGGKIVSAELLDYYEARVKYGLKLNLQGSVENMVDTALTRLAEVQDVKIPSYRSSALKFQEEALFVSGIELIDIPDSHHTFFPKGCQVEQVAIQIVPKLPLEKRYTINKDIWDAMSDLNKAGLILHEIFYRELLGDTSIYVRYVNGLVSADRLAEMKARPLELVDLLYKFNGTAQVSFGDYTVYLNNAIVPGYEIKGTSDKEYVFRGYTFKGSALVHTFGDGRVASVVLEGAGQVRVPKQMYFKNDLVFKSYKGTNTPGRVYISFGFVTNTLEYISNDKFPEKYNETLSYRESKESQTEVRCSLRSPIMFREDGTLMQCTR